MTQLPGESPIPSPLQAHLSQYAEIDLSVRDAAANAAITNQFSYELFGQISEAEGSEAALKIGGELGHFMLTKAIQDLYEVHGRVVSALMGPEAYRGALLGKAQYDTLPAQQKADRPRRNAPVSLYNYCSEISFWYANDYNPLGVFGSGPTEVRSIGWRGGSMQEAGFEHRRSVSILESRGGDVYLSCAPFTAKHDDPQHLIIRTALGVGIADEQEKAHDQPALDLIRMQLAADEPRKIDGVMAALPEARSLYQTQISRLQTIGSLSAREARQALRADFIASGFDDPLNEGDSSA